ncbi:unnamed protein product [Amoebophrya sp. A120]|nr:unnamed protein product [Amoebophrya sp. A120]|eukprot:GSA120T00000797001.1
MVRGQADKRMSGPSMSKNNLVSGVKKKKSTGVSRGVAMKAVSASMKTGRVVKKSLVRPITAHTAGSLRAGGLRSAAISSKLVPTDALSARKLSGTDISADCKKLLDDLVLSKKPPRDGKVAAVAAAPRPAVSSSRSVAAKKEKKTEVGRKVGTVAASKVKVAAGKKNKKKTSVTVVRKAAAAGKETGSGVRRTKLGNPQVSPKDDIKRKTAVSSTLALASSSAASRAKAKAPSHAMKKTKIQQATGASKPAKLKSKTTTASSVAMKKSTAMKSSLVLSTTTSKRPKNDKIPSSTCSSGPKNWQKTLQLMKNLRFEKIADVDVIGCNMLADRDSPDMAFHHLVAAMLSALTKDQYTAEAVRNLKSLGKGILSPKTVAENYSIDQIDTAIKMVGMHATKAKNLKATSEILVKEYNGKVPNNLEKLLKLPGVGPKMAFLVLQEAFGVYDSGICVDAHIHRICDFIGWTKNAKTPEDTRKQLEKFLPVKEWKEFNPLLVGMGQLLQTRASYLPCVAVRKDHEHEDNSGDDAGGVSHLDLVLRMGGGGATTSTSKFLLKPDPASKQSALTVAIELDQLAAVKFLVKKCGKEEAKKALLLTDHAGKRPLDYCSKQGSSSSSTSVAGKAIRAELEKLL